MALFSSANKFEYGGFAFITVDGLLLLSIILALTGISTIDWVEQTYTVGNLSFTVLVGLYKIKTITGSVITTANLNWCGNGDNVPSTAYCDQVEAVKGLVMIAAIIGFLALVVFTATRGRPSQLIALIVTLSTLLCSILLWSAAGVWGDVKDGYCNDFMPLYTSYSCKLGPSLIEVAAAGCLYFLATIVLTFAKVPLTSSTPLLQRIV